MIDTLEHKQLGETPSERTRRILPRSRGPHQGACTPFVPDGAGGRPETPRCGAVSRLARRLQRPRTGARGAAAGDRLDRVEGPEAPVRWAREALRQLIRLGTKRLTIAGFAVYRVIDIQVP